MLATHLNEGFGTMKLVTYNQAGQSHIGAVKDDMVVNLSAVAPDMLSLIDLGAEGLIQYQN